LPDSDIFNIQNKDINFTQLACQDALGSSFLLDCWQEKCVGKFG
jgi:hypothetical protein